MKKLFTLFALLFITSRLFANNGGPDAYGYIWRDSYDPNGPIYNWYDVIAMGGTEIKLLDDDNTRGPFQMNFNFRYYWYDVNQFWVGSNGYIMFNNGQISHPFPTIPNTGLPNDFLAVMMSDLTYHNANGLNPAKCYYWINQAHDSLIVSWIDVPFYDNISPFYQGRNSFQVILSMVDTTITYQYKTQQGQYTPNPINFMSIGIENNSGVLGLQHSYDTYPDTTYAIRYYYPQNSPYQVFDAAAVYNDNPETGGLFLPKVGTPFTMSTQIKNTGNQALGTFNVNGKIVNLLGVTQVQDNVSAMALATSATQNILFTNTWSHPTAGKYEFVTTTQLSNDAFIGNNTKTQELIVLDTTQTSLRLSFDNGTDAGLGGISWTGGGGGCGMYFIPPYYPCKVSKVHFYIVANPTGGGMDARLYDDDGINGAAYTLLDSIRVDSTNILTASWNDIVLDTPNVIISSGGFYVNWNMVGSGIALGQDNVAPFSNRTFEVLGNSWAIYRFRETQDLMINATIEHSPWPTGVPHTLLTDLSMKIFPNPSNDAASVIITSPGNLPAQIQIFDMSGKMVSKKVIDNLNSGATAFTIHTYDMNAGVYMVKVLTDNGVAEKKLVVVH